jgi:hypothetical protein
MKTLTRHVFPVLSMPTRSWAATVVALSLIVSAGNVSAQDPDTPVNIRGIVFDPLVLETAGFEDMDDIGIGRRLQVSDDIPDTEAVWRMLQFSRPMDRQLMTELRSAGLELTRYVNGVYIERISNARLQPLRDSQALRAAPRYQPAIKLFPSLRGPDLHADREFETERRNSVQGRWFEVTVFIQDEAGDIANAIGETSAEGVYVHGSDDPRGRKIIVFSLNSEDDELERQLAEVAQIEGIESINERGEFVNLNVTAASKSQSGNATNPSIWSRDITGENQVIGIYEDGIADTDHCFFRDDVNPVGQLHRKVLATRRYAGVTSDSHEHATLVAGNAAGDDVNNLGGHAVRGGAFDAKLVLINRNGFDLLLYSDPAGQLIEDPPTNLWDELIFSMGKGATIHNHSWADRKAGLLHTSWQSYSVYADMIDDFSRQFEDQLVVAAAGKNFMDWAAPASAKNALSVSAASAGMNSICQVFLQLPTMTRRKPDLAVIGESIVSSIPVAGVNDCGTQSMLCATSHSAPHASALAALVRQFFVDGHYDGGALNPTGSLVKAVLINSGRSISGGGNFPSYKEGWGVSVLDTALPDTPAAAELWVKDQRNVDAGALHTGERFEHVLSVSGNSEPLKVTLVWTDPSSGPGNDAINNNLDLRIYTPGNTTLVPDYLGNDFDVTNGISTSGGTADSVNNVEQVLIPAPQVGDWKIEVYGTAVNLVDLDAGEQGQGFALVVTADLVDDEGGGGTSASGDDKAVDELELWEILAILVLIALVALILAKILGLLKPKIGPKGPGNDSPDMPVA